MPSVSQKQHNAMEAAAHGNGNIGIPKKVGKEFAAADKGKPLSTKALADAMKKRKAKAMEPDDDDETMRKGGYSKAGGGVGSG